MDKGKILLEVGYLDNVTTSLKLLDLGGRFFIGVGKRTEAGQGSSPMMLGPSSLPA